MIPGFTRTTVTMYVILSAKDQLHEEKMKVMQQAITEGLKSDAAGVLDMQAIKKKARAKAGLNAD